MVDPSMAVSGQGRGDFRVGDVFSKSFEIFGRHVFAFLILALLSNILVFLYLFGLIHGVFTAGRAAPAIAGVLALLGSLIANGAIIYGVVQKLRNQDFSVGRSLQIGLSSMFPILGVSIVFGLAAGIGLVLLVVPGVIVFCMFYVALPACVVERPGVFGSLSRSAFLTKGFRWQIFGIMVVLVLANLVVEYLAGLLLASAGLYVTVFGPLVLSTVVSAFSAVINGVIYYQLRVAKEGVDIETIARVFD
jgi:hypothetical protein